MKKKKLKKKIKKLLKENWHLKKCILNPNSMDAILARATLKLLKNTEEAVWYGNYPQFHDIN